MLFRSAAIDPIQQAVNVAKFAGKKIGKGATEVQSVFTGAPSSALQVAKAAGSSADPAVREVFTKYLRGEGDAMDMAMTAQKALDAVRKDASDAYLTSKSGLAAAAAPMTDFSKIDTAITDARNVIQPSGIKHPSLYADANAALQEVEGLVNAWKATPSEHNLFGFDNQCIHSAYNYTDQRRLVYLIDIHRSVLGFPMGRPYDIHREVMAPPFERGKLPKLLHTKQRNAK